MGVTTDGFEPRNDAVRRDENGEAARLRETVDVLSDPEAVRALADAEPVVVGRDAVHSLVAERLARERR